MCAATHRFGEGGRVSVCISVWLSLYLSLSMSLSMSLYLCLSLCLCLCLSLSVSLSLCVSLSLSLSVSVGQPRTGNAAEGGALDAPLQDAGQPDGGFLHQEGRD